MGISMQTAAAMPWPTFRALMLSILVGLPVTGCIFKEKGPEKEALKAAIHKLEEAKATLRA